MHPKEFRRRIRNLQHIRIQEIMDGCHDCSKAGFLCPKHWQEGVAITLDPKGHMAELLDASAEPKEEGADELPHQ